MKRILYLTRGGAVGGSQRQLYYVVTNLNNSYKPIVVTRKDGQFFGQLQESGIETQVFPFHPWRKFPAGLWRYVDAERLVRHAKSCQVCLVHCSDLWLSGYMIWISKRLKIPSVLHVRTPICIADIHKHRCKEATAVIAISHRVKQNLLDAGIHTGKITQIDDAVDLNAFRFIEAEENVLRRDFSPVGGVLIGIVGRIEPSKQQLKFLQAAEQVLRDSKESVTFFIIGEDYCSSYVKRLKQLVNRNGLSKRVVFTGRRDDIPQVLDSLDILVSLSGGSVMFEAMSCGKVVVSAGFSSEENSVHIQNGKTGVLVSSTRSSDLVQALNRLIDAPEVRRRIGQEARKWAENNFCHIAMAKKTQQLYQRLLRS